MGILFLAFPRAWAFWTLQSSKCQGPDPPRTLLNFVGFKKSRHGGKRETKFTQAPGFGTSCCFFIVRSSNILKLQLELRRLFFWFNPWFGRVLVLYNFELCRGSQPCGTTHFELCSDGPEMFGDDFAICGHEVRCPTNCWNSQGD